MTSQPGLSTAATTSAALDAARALDSAGRHSEAIDTLTRSSRHGDLAAMAELGHRLLVGDRAPKSPQHALVFLLGAAKGGDARALARMATLVAAGAYVKQDWPGAIQMLGEAAANGDASARGQLTCLQPAGAPPTDWHAMAARVPLQSWLQPAPVVLLHEHVARVPDLVPAAVCAWLIGRGVGRLQPALVYDSVDHHNVVHDMRTNTMAVFDYASFDVVQFLVQARMALTCGCSMRHLEAPMVLHYEVGQQIQPHYDFIDAQAADYTEQIREQGQRMVTFLLYLNDDYAGGETTFPKLGIVHRGTMGHGLYFINAHADLSPDRRMLHTGSPPTAGEKWIVTQFVVSKPLRP